MKCRTMRHFIWVFTVCKNTHLGVSCIQRVKQISNFVLFSKPYPANIFSWKCPLLIKPAAYIHMHPRKLLLLKQTLWYPIRLLSPYCFQFWLSKISKQTIIGREMVDCGYQSWIIHSMINFFTTRVESSAVLSDFCSNSVDQDMPAPVWSWSILIKCKLK